MVSTANCQVVAPAQVWSAAPTLSPRVQRLRDRHWSLYERDYHQRGAFLHHRHAVGLCHICWKMRTS
jgi:hypothetical protein